MKYASKDYQEGEHMAGKEKDEIVHMSREPTEASPVKSYRQLLLKCLTNCTNVIYWSVFLGRLEVFCHQIHIGYALSPLPSPTRYMKEGGKWQTCLI